MFDPNSAQLVSASFKGETVISGAKLTLWRAMNSTEEIIVNAEGGPKDLPDLNEYHTVVHSWKVTPSADEVRIEADADNVVDTKDHFAVSYTYVIHQNGVLTVHYAVHPQVQARWLPFVGMALQTAPGMNHARWLGLGPLDAYPNENAAAILGLWSEDLPNADLPAVKSTRWAELTPTSGAGLHVEGSPYIRLGDASGLEVLSAVAGRPSKRNRAEFPEQRLDVNDQSSFVGEFNLSLVGAAQ
jgi:beta-galactosidase